MKIGVIYKGKSVETGKIIQGQLIECDGSVNAGRAFICPEVSSASYSGLYRGEGCLLVGPFISVDPSSIEIVPSEPEQPNTTFSFLYRDASNYKTYNEYVLAGRLTADEVKEIFACGDGENFISEQVGLDHDFPGPICEDDHAWCEFINDGIEPTDRKPTTELTAQELLANFRAAKGHWDEAKYDPRDI